MKKKLFTLLLALVTIATTARALENAIDGHEYVDLGLPSGTLWASCNVGATKPEEYGLYFAWGETVGYTSDTSDGHSFDWANYKWCNGSSSSLTKYTGSDGKTELDLEDDAAYVNWGSNWRMPSLDQIEELIDNCNWQWTTLNGVYGRKATSKKNGNSIFFPAAGSRFGTSLNSAGSLGYYWSRTLYASRPYYAYYLYFNSNNVYWYDNFRCGGQSVRPVVVNNQSSGLILHSANFPDANFRAALAEILGISEGEEITAAKIAATTTLGVSSKNIADLTGIEHFTALTELSCGGNRLTSLNVSKNTALQSLKCNYNMYWDMESQSSVGGLTMLDLSKNTALKELDCSYNQLTSLDVSNNIALTGLYCYNNQLTSLDVSNNTALTRLDCYYNQLTSLDVSKNTALTTLYCYNNQLTSLDVSQNAKLTSLNCYNNQLTSLDVSKNTALTTLRCNNNQLTALDVSKNTALYILYCWTNQLTSLDLSNNTALYILYCWTNQLTSLDLSNNTALEYLYCYNNQIKGEEMDALVNSLPTVTKGDFVVIDTKDENEGNVCTKAQVAVAKEKGWTVYDFNGSYSNRQEYEGSDPVEEEIDPVDEDDNVDFGSDMDESDDLNGNVIGDIFYNISDGNGEYNAEEGCIVLKKTTDDETVDGLSGKDIFGEDFKGQFTGILFKVPTGKGTVKVTAETTGNMLLKVKIGDNDPVEMELNGKLKISFPYNVSETTFVAIYAGAVNEAKGLGTTNATIDAALKIYGIEFERGETTGIGYNNRETITNNDWYTIDGVKLSGEPTKKGIYIHKGKKVIK